MQELTGQAGELKARWNNMCAGAANNSAAWQRQIPGALADTIEKSLNSTEAWLKHSVKISNPTPGSLIARSMAAVFLPHLLVTMSELEKGNFSQLHHFVDELTDLQTTILTADADIHEGDSTSRSRNIPFR